MNSNTPFVLAEALGRPARSARLIELGGASFGQTARLEVDGRSFFVKSMTGSQAGPLDAEADGLRRLAEASAGAGSKAIRIPAVHALVDVDRQRFLVLDWLDLKGLSAAGAARLGRQLACVHRDATGKAFGLERDNWIGGTPQINTPTEDWADFLFEHRLGALIARLVESGVRFEAATVARLRTAWVRSFPDYQPVPSLLHGDLWAGNAAMLANGTPVVFDPAVHYGDRECDLAMASLFGGFGAEFFEVYEARWPLEPGWERRREFYQLYHVLNHALLFGAGFMDDARRRIERLIKT
jgi:fructosamine-3-kinase